MFSATWTFKVALLQSFPFLSDFLQNCGAPTDNAVASVTREIGAGGVPKCGTGETPQLEVGVAPQSGAGGSPSGPAREAPQGGGGVDLPVSGRSCLGLSRPDCSGLPLPSASNPQPFSLALFLPREGGRRWRAGLHRGRGCPPGLEVGRRRPAGPGRRPPVEAPPGRGRCSRGSSQQKVDLWAQLARPADSYCTAPRPPGTFLFGFPSLLGLHAPSSSLRRRSCSF